MLTQSISTSVIANKISPAASSTDDQFCMITGLAGLMATEFSYKKDEEIYGEAEPSDYVYQIVRGSVRSYKLLSDGRRQIGAFYLPGDVFGLESGPAHRLTAEAIVDTTVRLVKRRSLEAGRRYGRSSCPQPLVNDSWRTSTRRRPHAASRPQERDGTRGQFSSGDGSSLGRNWHDGAPDVPQGHWRLSGVDPRDRVASAFATA